MRLRARAGCWGQSDWCGAPTISTLAPALEAVPDCTKTQTAPRLARAPRASKLSMFRPKLLLPALALTLLAALTLRLTRPARADPMTLFLGTYSLAPNGGICAARFDPDSGQLSDARVVAAIENPSWIALSPDARTLYALSESASGGVSAYSVEADGTLAGLNSQALGGGLAHLSVDATGKWLAASAYGAGQVALFPLEPNGAIGPQKRLIQLQGSGPNANRQDKSHAHQALFTPDNRGLVIADLGADKLWRFDFGAATGTLTPGTPAFVAVKAGAGPRHLAIAAGRAYVISELDNTLSVFADFAGAPRLIQTVSTLPAGWTRTSYAGEVAVSGDGRFLYASNRGGNGAPSSIAAFALAKDGQLAPLGWAQTGAMPRDFALDPTGRWLLAANQDERAVTVYAVDAKTGALSLHSKLDGIPGKPTCLVWGR